MNRKIIDIFLAALFALVAVNLIVDYNFQQRRLEPDQRAEIVEVVHGDTVDILRNVKQDTVRLLGIDTPEVYSQNKPSEFFLENTSKNRKCLREM